MKVGQRLLSQTFTGVHSEMPMKRKISMCTLHYDEVGVTMKEESFSLFHHMWFLRYWRQISAINKLFPYCLTGDKYKHEKHHETDSFYYVQTPQRSRVSLVKRIMLPSSTTNVLPGLSFSGSQPDFKGFLQALWFSPTSNHLCGFSILYSLTPSRIIIYET